MMDAVKQLRQSISTVRDTDLHFNVDPDSRRVQLEIVDRGTGNVVRQIPDEALVRFAKAFDAWLGTILDKEA
jgi:flagellar protein FlaG